MTVEPLDLSPIEDRDAHAECVAICHQPQADRRALLAEVKRLRAWEAGVRALFAGGPDTSCRTTWPDDGAGPIECVEVPLDDLRAALDEPEAPT